MSEIKNDNDTETQKKLDFWDFEALRDPNKRIERKSPFPNDRIVNKKEMDFYFEKLWGRISNYKDNKCFNFLEGFYNFAKKTYLSSNLDEASKNFDRSQMCLQLFSYCWEIDKKGGFSKLNGQQFTHNQIENKNLV
jgi:hypothetical protein